MCLKNKMESSRARVEATTLDVCGEVDLKEIKPPHTHHEGIQCSLFGSGYGVLLRSPGPLVDEVGPGTEFKEQAHETGNSDQVLFSLSTL